MKIPKNSMKNAWKHVIWWKIKGIKVLPNIDEENLGSFDHKKDGKKKKKKGWGIERGIKEIDKKELLKKSDLIPICFRISKSDRSRGIRQESKTT